MKFHAPDEWNISDNFMFDQMFPSKFWNLIEILAHVTISSPILHVIALRKKGDHRYLYQVSPIEIKGLNCEHTWKFCRAAKWMKVNEKCALHKRYHGTHWTSLRINVNRWNLSSPCSNRVKLDTKHDVTSRFISLYSSKFLFARRLPVSITRSRPLLIRNWEHSIVQASVLRRPLAKLISGDIRRGGESNRPPLHTTYPLTHPLRNQISFEALYTTSSNLTIVFFYEVAYVAYVRMYIGISSRYVNNVYEYLQRFWILCRA